MTADRASQFMRGPHTPIRRLPRARRSLPPTGQPGRKTFTASTVPVSFVRIHRAAAPTLRAPPLIGPEAGGGLRRDRRGRQSGRAPAPMSGRRDTVAQEPPPRRPHAATVGPYANAAEPGHAYPNRRCRSGRPNDFARSRSCHRCTSVGITPSIRPKSVPRAVAEAQGQPGGPSDSTPRRGKAHSQHLAGRALRLRTASNIGQLSLKGGQPGGGRYCRGGPCEVLFRNMTAA